MRQQAGYSLMLLWLWSYGCGAQVSRDFITGQLFMNFSLLKNKKTPSTWSSSFSPILYKRPLRDEYIEARDFYRIGNAAPVVSTDVSLVLAEDM